eukprot:SAG31_NODE_705_length_12695_cov_3.147007_11_plen_206_part_00
MFRKLCPLRRLLDADGSGAVDAHEFERGLARLLNRPLRADEVGAVFKRLDEDGNGVVDLVEFADLMRSGSQAAMAIGPKASARRLAAANGGTAEASEPLRPNSAPPASSTGDNAKSEARATTGKQRNGPSTVLRNPDFVSAREHERDEARTQGKTFSRARAAEMSAGTAMQMVLQPVRTIPKPQPPVGILFCSTSRIETPLVTCS